MKWLIFILLKVLEVGVVVFVPYWLGSIIEKWCNDIPIPIMVKWVIGVLVIVGIFLVYIFLSIISSDIINANLSLADKIMGWWQ